MRSRHALIHDKRDACRSSMIATHRSGCLFNKWTTVINLNWWSAIIELLVRIYIAILSIRPVDASTGFFGGIYDSSNGKWRWRQNGS